MESGITQYFGYNLAELLTKKLVKERVSYDEGLYLSTVQESYQKKTYSERISLHAHGLHQAFGENYEDGIENLLKIVGPENPNETGMFKDYYWLMPVAKYVELYGLDHLELSLHALEEITKRNTGEYAVRPFIRKYPGRCLSRMKNWARDDNFHLRRLASEGLRPKLPWASKLDVFVDRPEPVFHILNVLKEDTVKFVQKSVANNVRDYLKVNFEPAVELLQIWSSSQNKNTQWIIKHATRKMDINL